MIEDPSGKCRRPEVVEWEEEAGTASMTGTVGAGSGAAAASCE